ncbi:MAG: hypothetical protein U0X71_02815 [Sphingobacteriaceae bacterium]|jgi:hypothetical protein
MKNLESKIFDVHQMSVKEMEQCNGGEWGWMFASPQALFWFLLGIPYSK